MPSPTTHSALVASPSVSFQLSSTKSKLLFPQLSPAEDSYLLSQYTARNVAQRKKNQQPLRNSLHIDNELPIVGIVAQVQNKKELELLEQLVTACSTLAVQVVIIGEKSVCKIAKQSLVKHMLPTEANMHLFFGAADILVLPNLVDDAVVAACFNHKYS